MKQSKHQGFTLVEIMVVIGIIGILAAVTVANFGDIRATSRDTQRIENLKAVATSLQLFEVKYGRMPDCEAGIVVGPGSSDAGNEEGECEDQELLVSHFTEALSGVPGDAQDARADQRFIYYGERTCADGVSKKLVWTVLELSDQNNRDEVCAVGSATGEDPYVSFNGELNPPLHVIAVE